MNNCDLPAPPSCTPWCTVHEHADTWDDICGSEMVKVCSCEIGETDRIDADPLVVALERPVLGHRGAAAEVSDPRVLIGQNIELTITNAVALARLLDRTPDLSAA